MAVTAVWLPRAILAAFNEEIDIVGGTDDMYAALLDNTFVLAQTTQDYWDDFVADELANGNGYTTNGDQLTNDAFTQNSLVLTWDADDPSWTAATFTARHAAYVDRAPATDATRPVLVVVDFGADETVSAGTFTIVHNASGIANVTVS